MPSVLSLLRKFNFKAAFLSVLIVLAVNTSLLTTSLHAAPKINTRQCLVPHSPATDKRILFIDKVYTKHGELKENQQNYQMWRRYKRVAAAQKYMLEDLGFSWSFDVMQKIISLTKEDGSLEKTWLIFLPEFFNALPKSSNDDEIILPVQEATVFILGGLEKNKIRPVLYRPRTFIALMTPQSTGILPPIIPHKNMLFFNLSVDFKQDEKMSLFIRQIGTTLFCTLEGNQTTFTVDRASFPLTKQISFVDRSTPQKYAELEGTYKVFTLKPTPLQKQNLKSTLDYIWNILAFYPHDNKRPPPYLQHLRDSVIHTQSLIENRRP